MTRYNKKDAYHRRAKREHFAARSVYKLEEIDARYGILRRGDRVIDLGCAPGSWLQYTSEVIGSNGLVLGYDLAPLEVSFGPEVVFRQMDLFELTPESIRHHAFEALHGSAEEPPDEFRIGFDVLLSDSAPKTTGIRDADQARIMGIAEHAFALARVLLKKNGVFVTKVFQGRGFDALLLEIRACFSEVKVLKPKATREGSREAFIIAKGISAPPD